MVDKLDGAYGMHGRMGDLKQIQKFKILETCIYLLNIDLDGK
jgi:hypothetical protein